MQIITSKDGTKIAYEKSGHGPALILVVGAFNDRFTGAPLTQLLEKHFTVFNYDRRGKGNSGDTAPYAVEREIEDLAALITEAGGSACVFGYSSGAVLALKAVSHGLPITKLALYEPPPINTKMGELAVRIDERVKAGQRGDAVQLFQIEGVGIPVEIVAQIRNAPFWSGLEKVAHTLVYEMTILGDVDFLPQHGASIQIPTLVMDGENSPEMLHQSAQAVVDALPNAQRRILEGQTHDIVPEVTAPVVEAFLTAHPVTANLL